LLLYQLLGKVDEWVAFYSRARCGVNYNRSTRNIVPNLVYAASGHEVKTIMVAGRVPVRDGQELTADEVAVRAEAQAQAEALARRLAADPVHKGKALLEAMEAGRL
jgi:5-methylthioadenosine/S-adenosylhomocysteine deaminase